MKLISPLTTESSRRGASEDDSSILRFLRDPRPPQDPSAAQERSSAVDPQLQLLVEQLPAILWTTDRDLRFSTGLSAGLAAFGLRTRPGTSLFDHYGTRDPECLPIRAHLLALQGESTTFEQEWETKVYQTRVDPLRDGEGRVVGCIGMAVDITDRRQAEEALENEKERAQATLASIGDGVIRTDAEGRIDYMNPAAEQLTGWSAADALGKPASEVFRLVDEATRTPLPDPVERCLENRRAVESPGHVLLISADERECAVRDTAAPIRDREEQVLGTVLVFKDVSRVRGMEREMIYLASHDPLTGLINRREFEIRLRRAIRATRAEGSLHALLYLDLDEFKVVNDTCGHLVGDELLKQLTALLRSRVRRHDVLARLGGDEFGVLLEDCPLAHARQIAEELRRTVREFRFRWRDRLFDVGVSIGLVPIGPECGDLNQVLSAADAACYVAKDSGRNRVHEYEQDDTLVAERYGEMQWIHRIQDAFEEQRFRLYYQMIQPLSKETVPAAQPPRELLCEVFLRMLDRQGRLIEPTSFIAAAERYHLIGKIDRWVVTTAFDSLAEAQRRRLSRPVLFALNISGCSLADESFLSFVEEELERSRVDPASICFEVTETAAIRKLDAAIRFMSALKGKGCRFVLDDFGSGLSSFAYLRDLPVDYLKIDGEFVRDMMDDRVKRAMVESIHQIGHVMGLQTIAEWVENRSTLEELKALGVDYAQGYWVCRPQPLVHER